MANIRITSVTQRPDGLLEVSGVLPDGAHVENVVVASQDRAEIARALVTAEYRRPLPHLTGFVDLSDAEYDALRPQGHAKNAHAAAQRLALEESAEESEGAAEEATESEGESSESAEGDAKPSRRARR